MYPGYNVVYLHELCGRNMYGDCDTYTSHRLNNNNSITTETYFMLLKIYPVQTSLN